MVCAWAAAAVSAMPVVSAAPPTALIGLPRKTFAVKTPSDFSLSRTRPSSVVNQYLQRWDVPNVFSFGAAGVPQNITYNYVLTIGAMTYWALDAIQNKYLKSPEPLVPG